VGQWRLPAAWYHDHKDIERYPKVPSTYPAQYIKSPSSLSQLGRRGMSVSMHPRAEATYAPSSSFGDPAFEPQATFDFDAPNEAHMRDLHHDMPFNPDFSMMGGGR